MSDIFVSYASEDRSRAQMLTQRLEGRGWSVFWDRTIPFGKTWRQTIEKELINARCVIVLWSKSSIESSWVQEEADEARRRGVLLPVLIEKVEPPFGFRSIQAADLVDWNAAEPPQVFDRLLADIAALVGHLPKEAKKLRAEAGFEQKIEKHERSFFASFGRSAQPRFFISYRREDSIGMTGRLHDRLAQTFGHNKVFMDVGSIPVGEDFVRYINNQVAACDVILVVIGPDWLKVKNKAGKRRLHQPDDFVATEIGAALARNIRVIPILVEGARMPKASELPDSIKPLARRSPAEVRHKNFFKDTEALIEQIRKER